MTLLLIVISVSLSVSFLCSVLEVVLLSLTHPYVALLEQRGSAAGTILAELRQDIERPISAILTLNTIAHTVGAAVSGAIALEVLGSKWMALFSAVLTLAILVFSEIIPKTLGAQHWQRLAPATAYTLKGLTTVMTPILIPLSWINRLFGAKQHGTSVSRAELLIMAEIGRREGQLDEEEGQVVSNVMGLKSTLISEVMTPRTSMVAIAATATLAETQDLMLETGYLRLPVYEGTLDHVVGVVVARDLWRAARDDLSAAVSTITRPPTLVPATLSSAALLGQMRQEQIKMAVVLDEFGGTAGLCTLEDLVEEIVGELRDEHESELPDFEDKGSFTLVAGAVALADFVQRFGLELETDLHDTLGGYVFGSLGRLPAVGDELTVDGGLIRVVAMDGRRVAQVSFAPAPAVRDPA